MCCQCRRSLNKDFTCYFSRPCGKEAFVRLLPPPPSPLFRQHRPPHFVYCVYPRPVVNKKRGGLPTVQQQSHLLWLSSKKRVAVSPSTVCGIHRRTIFSAKAWPFFSCETSQDGAEKKSSWKKKRQLLCKMTILFLSNMHWLGGEKRQLLYSFDFPPLSRAKGHTANITPQRSRRNQGLLLFLFHPKNGVKKG